MQKYRLLSISRVALSSVFVFFALLGVSSAQSAERIKSNEIGRWVVDGFEIYVDIKCDISRSNLLPTKYCDQPYVVISKAIERGGDFLSSSGSLYFKLIARNIELGDKWMFDGNDDPQRRVPLSDMTWGNQRSEELFKLLMSKPNLQLKFMTRAGQGSPIKARTIVLSDFKPQTDELIVGVNYRYDQEEATARRDMLIGLVAIVGLLAMIIWLTMFLIKRARKQLKTVKQHIETKRVSRVAEDEAIREVVRNSVQKADDKSLDALRSQIKAALDSGDTKTAEELLRILNRLDQKSIAQVK